MNHSFLLFFSSKEIADKIDVHINDKSKGIKDTLIKESLGSKPEIIPASLAAQIDFLHCSDKFKDCKDFAKKIISTKPEKYNEVLYDGNVNDLNTIFENEFEAYWVLRVPNNSLLTTYNPIKNKNHKKGKYVVLLNSNEISVIIGVADSIFQALRIIEESSGIRVKNEIVFNDTNEVVALEIEDYKYKIRNQK